jgi:electron transport complex protein RnfG
MAKTPSTLKNMFLTLFTITVVAGGALGWVFTQTEKPIALAKVLNQQEAIKLVVPDFNNNPADEMTQITGENGQIFKVYKARKDSVLVGYAVESSTQRGFGGEIKVMVGFMPDGTIINYKVLEHKETPGLGSKMGEWFRSSGSQDEGAAEASFFKWFYGIKAAGGNQRSVINKNPGVSNLTVTKDDGEVDAITAATISSRAFLDAVSNAYKAYISAVADSSAQRKNIVQ